MGMKSPEPYWTIAEALRWKIFYLGRDTPPGELFTPEHYTALESLLAKQFQDLGTPVSADTVTQVAHNLPVIDLDPMDAYPNDDKIREREIEALARQIERVSPGLK